MFHCYTFIKFKQYIKLVDIVISGDCELSVNV